MDGTTLADATAFLPFEGRVLAVAAAAMTKRKRISKKTTIKRKILPFFALGALR